MLQRVAVLSDIHGALPALEAVLAEPEVAGVDRIVVTGDIASGAQPVEVLDRLVEEGQRRGRDRGVRAAGRAGRSSRPRALA